jgi:hypothetical protein
MLVQKRNRAGKLFHLFFSSNLAESGKILRLEEKGKLEFY